MIEFSTLHVGITAICWALLLLSYKLCKMEDKTHRKEEALMLAVFALVPFLNLILAGYPLVLMNEIRLAKEREEMDVIWREEREDSLIAKLVEKNLAGEMGMDEVIYKINKIKGGENV